MRRMILLALFVSLVTLLAAETVTNGAGVNSATVLSSTPAETVIQYEIGRYEKKEVEIDGQAWYEISLAKEGRLLEKGYPELPVFNRSIIIDGQALMKAEVYDLEFVDTELPVAPSKGNLPRSVDPESVPWEFGNGYQTAGFWPAAVATLSEPYIMRDYRGIVVQVAPFAYNPKTRILRQYTSFKVRVYADGVDTVNTLTREPVDISREFVDVYANHFLNWGPDRYTSVSDSFGWLLIIYHPDRYEQVLPLYEWKRQKGIYTYMRSTTETGSTATAIQAYIQDFYDTYPALSFVLLVGDHAQVPALFYSGGGADPVLALVDGTDSYPDIFVGRLSATTAAEVTTQVSKIITSEKGMGSTATWIDNATGIASNQGPGDDGEYDYQHLNNIRTDLLAYGYSPVDQIYDPGATAAQVTTAINSGRGLVNYTGHGSDTSWSTTGFSNTNVAALSNGNMIPVVVSVACYNGNFTGTTCFAEAWQRHTNGGSIGFYGSSIGQSWNPPMAAQDEIADLLVADAKITLGGLLFNGACKMLDDYPAGGPEMYKTWNLFGDPTLLYRSDNPTTMAVSFDSYMDVGETTSLTVTTNVPYAYVGVSRGTAIHGRGYANAAGVATISLSSLPSFPAEFTVTVTAHNKVTYQGTLYQGYIWEGDVSTVWSASGNWNVNSYPQPDNDVLIPAGCDRYPNTSAAIGYCNNLILHTGASITVSSYDLIVSGNALIEGQLIMNNFIDFEVMGNVIWASGSSVSISHSSAEIICQGHMTFESGSNFQMDSGYMTFGGSSNSYLYNFSSATQIFNLRSDKSSSHYLSFHGDSTHDFIINGSIWCYDGSGLYCWYNGNVSVRGPYFRDYNTGSYGVKLYYGTLIMDGSTQQLDLLGSSCYLNNLVLSPTTEVFLTQNLTVNNDLTMESGVFDPGAWGITIGGNWIRTAATDAFAEGTSTVTFNGSAHQYCNHSENFNNLVVNKSGGALRVNNPSAVVACASYDWIAGAVDVLTGTFTANSLAANLIEGAWYLNENGTINLYATGTGRYIHLDGELHIFGGNFNVYGGSIRSRWPYTNDALVEMSGGVLDFHDQGVWINNNDPTLSFTDTITGGRIRMTGSLSITRSDFNPSGNIFELYGSGDYIIAHDPGSSLFTLIINKASAKSASESLAEDLETHPGLRSNSITAESDLDINGFFQILAGTFIAPANMNVRGSWFNSLGEAAFTEGTGLVVFDGNALSTIYADEVFYSLELAKSTSLGLQVASGYSVTCSSYDWTQGTLNINGGTLTALDMVDAYIMGVINLGAGSIHFHQDAGQYLDIQAELNISGGELHLYGGTPGAYTYIPNGGNASLTMSDGLLYRHDDAIYVYAANVLTSNITGGIIRTDRSFFNIRTDFNPSGGTVELTSTTDASLAMYAGSLWNVKIRKGSVAKANDGDGQPVTGFDRNGEPVTLTRSQTASLLSNLTCNGNLTVESGTLSCNTWDIHCDQDILVYGILNVDEGACVYLTIADGIYVYDGGRLEVIGTSAAPALISRSAGNYYLNIFSGATIAAEFGIFEYFSTHGVNVQAGASVDPNHAFTNCIFRYGIAGGTLLTLNNSQNLLIANASFPTNAGGGATNVRKTVNEGIVNMSNATGGFAGETYDDDNYYRIYWTTATASPDLRVLKAVWSPATPDPYLGDTRTLTVTVVNASTSALAQSFFLDLYYNQSSPPSPVTVGDRWMQIPSLPAGLPVDYLFMVANYDALLTGQWYSWLQIDTDNNVAEAIETNNIYGAFTITWLPLPVIDPLYISYNAGDDDVVLGWTYPISVSRFNVYADTDPFGTFSTLLGYSLTTEFEDTTPGPRRFYRVKAERFPAKKEEMPIRAHN
ncbi:MAG: C25 family cysteine peptidase [Candidatus Cloacimonetes bacterium]|nr:C25 family cysteine peptidase [Candidatus Cloacimonadota bacterium]